MAVEVGVSERLPLASWLVIAGFVGVHVGAGLALGEWRWLALSLLLVPAAAVAGALSGNGVLAVVGGALYAGAGLPPLALGIGGAKLLGRITVSVRLKRVLTAGAVALLALVALPLPLALVEKHRTVRVEGARPRMIDERRGTIAGVGLGDRPAGVQATFGSAQPWRTEQDTGPLDPPDCRCDTASASPEPSDRDTFLRYRKLSFWINGGRVRSIEIADPGARTTRGIGVGDSLSLVRRAYPELDCSESSYSEESIPYPFCAGRTGARTSIYFSADYSRPGTPVMDITVASRFDQPGSSEQPSD